MTKILLITFIIAILSYSCKTDFEINDEWQDITVVYSILNEAEEIHYIRIGKAFLGNYNAYEMAANSDSLLYNYELNVRLEEWKNTVKRKDFICEKIYIDKDTGIFANNNHYVYKTTGKLDKTANYKIIIEKPDGTIVSSEIALVGDFNINKPSIHAMEKVPLFTLSPYSIEWTSTAGGRLYSLEIFFHYIEITATDTLHKTLAWSNHPSKLSQTLTGGEKMSYDINGLQFQNFVKSNITSNENVIKRIPKQKTLDFKFYVGDDNLYTYLKISEPSSGLIQEKPAFTNINNGIGLFASRYFKYINGKTITDRTIDSLAKGQITKDLKFLPQADVTSYWSMYPE